MDNKINEIKQNVLNELVENHIIKEGLDGSYYEYEEEFYQYDEMDLDYFLLDDEEKVMVEAEYEMNLWDSGIDFLRGEVNSEINDLDIDFESEEMLELGIEDVDLSDEMVEEINILVNLNDLFELTHLKANILLNTNEEWNYDNTTNTDLLEQVFEDLEDDYKLDLEDVQNLYDNSSIGLLVTSQGYTLEDLFDNDKIKNSKFLTSLVEEHYSLGYDVSNLTVLLEMRGNEFLESTKVGSIITVNNVTLGLFGKHNGSGSMLGIKLEKPFTFTVDEYTDFQVEYASNNNGYTVNDVYGLCGTCWSDDWTIGESK